MDSDKNQSSAVVSVGAEATNLFRNMFFNVAKVKGLLKTSNSKVPPGVQGGENVSAITSSNNQPPRSDNDPAEEIDPVDPIEEGYLLCLMAVTSILNTELSADKQIVLETMQKELIDCLGPILCVTAETVYSLANEVFDKMTDLATFLSKVVEVPFTLRDCFMTFELLATPQENSYSQGKLNKLRAEGYSRYFNDIITVYKMFN